MADSQSTTLEQVLGDLLDQERFDPPEDFAAAALITDLSEHEKAAEDFEGWWAEQAKALHWFTDFEEVLDDSNPPFYKWFTGRQAQRLLQLPGPPRRDRPRRRASPSTGAARRARSATSPTTSCLRDVQRFANALKDHGIEPGDIVGIYLPMIPEVVVAMLACARIGAPHNVVFGGFCAESVKERMEFSHAKALVTVDGARRKGKTAAIKQAVDEVMGDLDDLETIFVVKHTGEDAEMKDGRDVWYHEALEAADDECEAEALDAEHPLYILYSSGSTAKPKGILHTTGGYLTHVAWTPQARLRPQARRGRVLVLGRRRLGHRALLHRLRAAGERRDVGDVRGRAGLPRQGHLVGAVRALRRDDLLHRADGDPRLHEVGRGVPRAPRPVQAAAAGHRRRADQPQGLAVVPRRSSAAGAARSSTPGGRPRPAGS